RVESYSIDILAYAPDGKTLVGCNTLGGTFYVWDMPARTLRHRVEVFSSNFPFDHCFAIAPNAQQIACAENLDGRIKTTLTVGGKTFVSENAGDGKIRLWDVATGKELAQWVGHREGIRALAFSPDGQTLASITKGKVEPARTLVLWAAATHKERS